MKVYVRAPYEEACLAELKELFDEVVYEPWTTTGQRYYEDEMLEHLLAVQPDALITELDRVTEKVLAGYDRLKFIGDCRGTPANLQVDACTKAGVPILCTPGRLQFSGYRTENGCRAPRRITSGWAMSCRAKRWALWASAPSAMPLQRF